MKNQKQKTTPREFVFKQLLNGKRVNQELVLRKTNYWRLAAIIYEIEKKYNVRIHRIDMRANYAEFQRSYWLDNETIRRIKNENA